MSERLSIHKDNTKEQNTQAILEVINYVEWDRVYKAMVTLDWTWHGVGIPTVEDLKRKALSLAERCVNISISEERDTYTSTGGIEVRTQWFQEGDVGVQVRFILSEFDNYL